MKIESGLLLGCIVLTAGACASSGRADGPVVGRAPPEREVVVENWTGTDLQVYAFYGGDSMLLGKVRSVSSRVVRLPDAAGGEIRLLTSPTGQHEARHVSEPIHVSFGQRVVWQLRATGGSAITHQPSAVLRSNATRDRVGR